jgi:hypothetical protein
VPVCHSQQRVGKTGVSIFLLRCERFLSLRAIVALQKLSSVESKLYGAYRSHVSGRQAFRTYLPGVLRVALHGSRLSVISWFSAERVVHSSNRREPLDTFDSATCQSNGCPSSPEMARRDRAQARPQCRAQDIESLARALECHAWYESRAGRTPQRVSAISVPSRVISGGVRAKQRGSQSWRGAAATRVSPASSP